MYFYFPSIAKEYHISETDVAEAWTEAIEEVYDKLGAPPLHVWESGFTQGEATDEEVRSLAKRLNCSSENVYDVLNAYLERAFRKQLETREEHSK